MSDKTQKEHLAWLEKLARDEKKKYEQKRTQLEKLINDVNELAREAADMQRAVDTVRSSLGLSPTEPSTVRFSGMSIKAAAEKAMREAGGQMRIVDLVKAFAEGGKDLGKSAYTMVAITLDRNKQRFERVERGLYRVIETG